MIEREDWGRAGRCRPGWGEQLTGEVVAMANWTP
jgi:hypothetical protein